MDSELSPSTPLHRAPRIRNAAGNTTPHMRLHALAALLASATALSTPTAQLSRAATFWRYATPVVAKYLGQLASIELQERLSGTCLSDEECAVAWEDAHVSGASAFRKTVDDLGGFYVKTGQIVASRQDLFPKQYSNALAGLTDFVDPLPSRRCGASSPPRR